MVLVSAAHQHGSAVCVTGPPTPSLPSRLCRALCELPESQGTFPRGLFYTSCCARFHDTLSVRPTLSFPSVSTKLLFMRDTRSASPWAQWCPRGREPRGDARGIRRETDSSPALECGFPPSHPPSGPCLLLVLLSSALLGSSPWVLPVSSGLHDPWAGLSSSFCGFCLKLLWQ